MSTRPSSSGFFPKSYFLFEILTMYLAIADDSVSLKSPLIKYGKLGKSNPSLNLSPLPNQFSGPEYTLSSQGSPVYESKSLSTCPLPLRFQ